MKRRNLAVELTAMATLFFAHSSLSAVGRTPGQFSVSATGSAQYSIPLWTPPGIRGIQPQLSLTYDSHLSYGIMGPGWTLGGLSTISRCNPTYAQDGAPAPITLTTADGFCMDGNRLRGVPAGSTTTYQTEIANFSQVTAVAGTNGPSYFTVKGKDGLTYEYGATADSKILPSGQTTPYIWALDKVTDRAGNQMTFTYYQAGGAYVPLSIQYTAPSGSTSFPYQVNFTYSTKSTIDTLSKFISGASVQQTQQLSTITMTSSGTTVREYKLLYTASSQTGRATLTSIQECGGSAGTDCLVATSVAYQPGAAGVAAPTTASGSGATNGTVYSVDIDGDGKEDLVYAVASGANYQWWVQLSNGSGYGAPINSGAVTVGTAGFLLDDFDAQGGTEILASNGGFWYAYKLTGSSFTATPTGVSVSPTGYYSSIDVDGDGKPDIVNVTPGSSVIGSPTLGDIIYSVQLNTSSITGSGTTISFASTPVVQNVATGLPSTPSIYGSFGNNQLQNSSVKHFDFDGDGRQDIVLSLHFVYARVAHYLIVPILSRGTGVPVFGTGNGSGDTSLPVTFEMANWNDDACTDIIANATVLISPCNGSAPGGINLPYTPSIALDWDGDGRTDALANVGGTWQVYRSEGTTFAAGASTGISVGGGTYGVTDTDADGLPDVVYSNSSASNAIYFGLHNGAGLRPDLASKFTDGYNNYASPTYVPITWSNYVDSDEAIFPYQEYIGPLYVVKQATFSDPSSRPTATYSQTFNYTSAQTNLQGRGFQGFVKKDTADSRTPVVHEEQFQTTFPYTGMKTSDLTMDGIATLVDWEAAPAVKNLDTIANNQRYFPYINQAFTALADLEPPGGTSQTTAFSTTTYTYTFDSYGNATNVVTQTQDINPNSPYYQESWTSTVVNTIAPDTANWCLNLPTQMTTTNSGPSGPAITRTVSYPSPDYANCRETQKVVEPSSSQFKVTTVYGFDSYGNTNSVAVTGVGMPTRTTGLNWGTTGQFLTTVTQPLAVINTYGYDATNGMRTSAKDANGITTSWQYDNFARPVLETRPDGTSTTVSYNNCATNGCVNANNQTTVTATVVNVGGTTQSIHNIYLDANDRSLVTSSTMLNGAFDRTETQYDALGRVHLQGAPCTFVNCAAYWATNTYDDLNRLTQTQRPISATNSALQTTKVAYSGTTTTVTDALSHVTTKIQHVNGLLGHSVSANAYYQNFTYDAFGSLLGVKDSNAYQLFTAAYDYGIAAFQNSSTDMDMGAHSYTFDALGELVAYSDAKNQSFTMSYDLLSRPSTRTEPDLTTNWNWGGNAAKYDIGKLNYINAVSSLGTLTESYTYDSSGRLSAKAIALPGDTTYTYTTTYNATTGLLDTLQYPTSTAYQLKLQYGYANGILKSISDFNASSTIFWTANSTNPAGQISQETLGNGVVATRNYDAVTGWLGSVTAGPGGGTALQNASFLFDRVGNVTERQNNNLGLTENFYYDTVNRLDHSTLGGTTNLQMAYGGGLGNITSRSDVAGGATWTYDSVKKHAVTQAGSSSYTYTYDANGNAITRNGSNIAWSSYNYPTDINTSSEEVQFWYGPNRERWKEYYTSSAGTEVTYRASRLLEKVINGSATDYRHYIFAGHQLVGVYSRTAAGVNTMRYVMSDHQGSVDSIDTGTSPATDYVNESFTAYGNRRNGETWSGAPTTTDETAINTVSRAGYTGQTVLGISMGLSHLNGRVLDAVTGRFLSPDPYVPNPGNTQSYNRYSYANNNPLSRIDTTGFDDAPACQDCGTFIVNGINDAISALGSAGDDLGDFFGSIWHAIFGGGGKQLSANDRVGKAHGVNISSPIQGTPSGAQVSDGWKYSLDSSVATQGAQVTALSEVTVTAQRLPTEGLSTGGSIPSAAGSGGGGTSLASRETAPSGKLSSAGIVFPAIMAGRAFEASFNGAFNVASNGAKFFTNIGNTIPDLYSEGSLLGELKAGKYVYNTAQIARQLAVAQAERIPYFLITSPTTTVAGTTALEVANTGGQVLIFDAEAETLAVAGGGELSPVMLEFLAAFLFEE